MKIFLKLMSGSFLVWFVAFGFCSSAYALNLGTNITIFDGSHDPISSNSWYNGTNEDQEVEPGCVANQSWDLEGFFLNGSELQVVGGFDFLATNEGYAIGDIFLDIDGNYNPDAVNRTGQNGQVDVEDNFGYEYVVHFNLDTLGSTYAIYDISGAGSIQTVYYGQNHLSNPYRCVSGGSLVGTADQSLKYESGLSDSDVGFSGGNHYALSGIDLGFIAGKKFTAHLTLGCGNDNLMGQGTAPVPEPATLILMGTGLIGLAGLGRRKIKKKA